MPSAEQNKFFINFTSGLNTEATPLNFPENSAQELDNYDLFRTGEIKRRLGLEFENAYTVRPETTPASDIDTYAISTHEWKAVNGRGDLNFLVVQIGVKLFFHDLGSEPISGTLRGELDLGEFKIGPAPEIKVIDTAFGEGIMAVANEHLDTIWIEYDSDTDTFIPNRITIKIRDFDGVEEVGDPEPDFRDLTITDDHRYNLRNQGWPTRATCNVNQRGSSGVAVGQNPIDWTRSKIGRYPSNADIFFAAKASAARDSEVIGAFSPFELDKLSVGNTPAPKGHFILDLFSKDRKSVTTNDTQSTRGGPRGGRGGRGLRTALTKLTVDLEATDKRPSIVAFYAGRLWYAGIPDKNFTGDLFFSQSLTSIKFAGRCYQEQDPTAEDLNSLLATDGGGIHIADMGQVYWGGQVGQDLIFVSSTGVYAISGSDGANFTSDDFTVRKITDEGTVGQDSVIEAEGSLFWWSDGGIWNMSGSQITNELQVNRITKDTIQTFYDDIDPKSRAYVRGFYDDFSKKIYWFYNDTPGYDAINFRFRYNRALVLDLTIGAFYTYTIEDLDNNSPWISSMLQKKPGSTTIVTYDIVLDDDDVVLSSDDIVQDVSFDVFTDVKLKLLTFVENVDTSYSYTFSEFDSRNFVDWLIWDKFKNGISSTGADYTSVIQAGWQDFADPIRLKYITHLTSFFNRTEDGYELDENSEVVYANPSSAKVQTRWEYTDLDNGQWTKEEQAYRLFRQYIPADENDPFDYAYSVIRTKLRMRGAGHAFSIRYSSDPGKDMQLLGFAVNVRSPTKV